MHNSKETINTTTSKSISKISKMFCVVVTAVLLLLSSLPSFSQTSSSLAVSSDQQPGSAADLSRYLWSYSKNMATSEKPLIDFDVMDNWRGLGDYLSASDDGGYFAYTINKMEYNEFMFGLFAVDSLVIQSTKSGWRIVFEGLQPGLFTADSRQYIFQDEGALCFLILGGTQVRKIADVASYKISQNKWLAYQLKGNDNLILQNLSTGKEKIFAGITDYEFNSSGDWVVCKSNTKELLLYGLATGSEKRFSDIADYAFSGNGKSVVLKTKTALQCINLSQEVTKTIWSANGKSKVGNYNIDATGNQIVFTVLEDRDANDADIWYYESGMDKAVLKIANKSTNIDAGLKIKGISFADNGRYLQLSLQEAAEAPGKPNSDIAGLEVWNHKDLNLQSAQPKLTKRTKTYSAIVNIETGKLVFLEGNDKKLLKMQGDFALIKKDYREVHGDRFWEKGEDSCWLISLKDGNSHLLPTKSRQFWFSPAGNYLVYFDVDKGCHYFSYDLRYGVIKDIAANIPNDELGFVSRQQGETQNSYFGNLAAWIEKDGAVLVYDNYDIWKLDLAGKQPAINITNGLGRSDNTILNLFSTDHYSTNIPIIKADELLVLRGYNISNKQSGFYKKVGVNIGDPTKLYMGDYFISSILGCQSLNLSNRGLVPVKAKNNNTWIVQRQSVSDAPNYYETTDFKNYRRLTNFQPQKGYQWLTEELVSFKHLDGKMGQGILYKPENFDPKKKYPVLIAFYENFSDNMNQFRVPRYLDQAMGAGKSPLWFLNNGYLVFAPDIAVTPMKYGPQAYTVIEGAAQYLKRLPYVDANKLGCGSHSWSAKLGAYIFTNSKSIAATAITEGFLFANVLNQSLSSNDGKSRLEDVEKAQDFGSLWDNKELWLDQTTILNVDKSTSPLLLLCNKESSEDYQDQTFQLFNALRRLNKNVWWLKYDKGGHTLSDQKELKDYTIRYTQFFDHYLKNAPAPRWMTEGIPLKLKGIESRYELDPQGTCNSANGEPCPICQAWNAQYKRKPEMFQKEIKDWVLDKDIAAELERKQNTVPADTKRE